MSGLKVGGVGQGLNDKREHPESTGLSLKELIRSKLLPSGSASASRLQIVNISILEGYSNGTRGKKVYVSFDVKKDVNEISLNPGFSLNRTDEWFFAGHLKLSNEEIVHIMRSNLR